MVNSLENISILIAEDDMDDRLMIQDGFDELRVRNTLQFVEDGEDLLDYLKYRGQYTGADHGLPDVILLDLNMPRKDGREALTEIKHDEELNHIPVLVLTTSRAEEDILRSYKLGVAGFVVKPVTFQGLVNVLKSIGNYWVEIVELPHEKH
jgi:CheY-like chemotaxis protein